MALGRIKRSKHKVAKLAMERGIRQAGTRRVKVEVTVDRTMSGRYMAKACLGSPRPGKLQMTQRRTHSVRCSRIVHASTPQGAIARALKGLSGQVAQRGRKLGAPRRRR